ncbi:MAG: LapA family protein [Bacteroidales bacterium]|nr:LapA family protein [Bacteroidales bacterium]
MQRVLIIALLLALIVVVFALQNAAEITVKFFFWEIQSTVAIVLTAVLLIGALLGVLFSLPSIIRKSEKITELEDKLLENKGEDK